MLLEELLKHTNALHPDFERLRKALEGIKTVAMELNDAERKAEEKRGTMDVLHRLQSVDLIEP
eukprot:COSAG01_NODE_64979_length_274_cov_1.731429_1_plen_62_part_01